MEQELSRRSFMKTTVGGTALALGGAAAQASAQGTSLRQDMSFFEVAHSRRSVRNFTADPVPEADLLEILDAARMAPTSGNQQPWKFLVIRDRTIIDDMREACIAASIEARRARGGQITDDVTAAVTQSYEGYFSAPVYVVILTDNESRYPSYNHWDGPLAAGYLMLAARALGYGTVFITDSIPPAVTKEVLGIPDRYTRVCITPVGVPVEWPETPDKKPLDEFIVRDRF
jgi:nitroreductase